MDAEGAQQEAAELRTDGADGDVAHHAGAAPLHHLSRQPPRGLGPFDLDHGPRAVGSLPDQGAFERGALRADGFERGDLRPWSAPAP